MFEAWIMDAFPGLPFMIDTLIMSNKDFESTFTYPCQIILNVIASLRRDNHAFCSQQIKSLQVIQPRGTLSL